MSGELTRRLRDAHVLSLRPGHIVVVTLDLGGGRTIVLPPVALVAGVDDALVLNRHAGTTPFVRYADGTTPPYLLDVKVVGSS